jgi:hypothetical protein
MAKNLFRIFVKIGMTVLIFAFMTCGDPEGGPTGSPTSPVIISPGAPTIAQGETQDFTAVVTGSDDPDQTVTWTVEGAASEGTVFSGATLTVAADESAATLTVRASSVADPTLSGTITVTVSPSADAGIGLYQGPNGPQANTGTLALALA